MAGTRLLVGAAPIITNPRGVKDISVGLFPSGADTVKVEVTLNNGDDATAKWLEVIAATNTPSIITLTGPVNAIRATRVTGAASDNELQVYIPSN